MAGLLGAGLRTLAARAALAVQRREDARLMRAYPPRRRSLVPAAVAAASFGLGLGAGVASSRPRHQGRYAQLPTVRLSVESTPPGVPATLRLSGRELAQGVTPFSAEVPRGAHVTASYQGGAVTVDAWADVPQPLHATLR